MTDALQDLERKYQRERRQFQQLCRETLTMIGCVVAGACAFSIGLVLAAITSVMGGTP